MTALESRRRFFAEEIEAIANLRTPGLVDAFAAVPRERFLSPGPWTLRSDADIFGSPRQSADADPRHVYHNVAIAIDAGRQLFNGVPAFLGLCIDALALGSGNRALHVGCGLGYYSAVIAELVGAAGRVEAFEVDADLAAHAAENLRSRSWVGVTCGDSSSAFGEPFDAILINAGVTHPLPAWLDALAPGGRMVLPITASMPAMGTIGKGIVVVLTKTGDPLSLDARPLSFVAIYSALGVRDESLNQQIGLSLQRMPFPRLRKLRLDPHDSGPQCWLHGSGFCLST